MNSTRLSERFNHLLCGLGGHEMMRAYEPGHVFLRCISCAYETPGWTLKEMPAPPRRQSVLLEQNAHV